MERMKKLKSNSIMKKMLFPMIVVMLVQAGLFAGTILWGGTIEQLNNNSFDILNERVINRKNYLQNEMIQRWSNLTETEESVNNKVARVLAQENAALVDITANSPLAVEILEQTSTDILYLIRKNSVTGAFLILNGQDSADLSAGDMVKSGLYIRDDDPVTNPNDTSDLLIERAPSAITKTLGIPMDTGWYPTFQFYADDPEYGRFYQKPFQAAVEHPQISAADLGYWCRPFCLYGDEEEVITYSIPLRQEDGTAYGVLGVELKLDYLRTMLPSEEVDASDKGAYLLCVDENEDMQVDLVLASGPISKVLFGEEKRVVLAPPPDYTNVYRLERNERITDTTFASLQYLKLYNSNTPFENEKWALAGIVQSKTLLSFSRSVQTAVLIALVLSLFISIVSVLMVGSFFTKPITALVRKVRESDPTKPVQLEKTRITEIDELASAVEALSSSVFDSASKLSQIIHMANIPIGAFEQQKGVNRVFCTDGFFDIMEIEGPDKASYLPVQQFARMLREKERYVDAMEDGGQVKVYRMLTKEGVPKWVRVKLVQDGEHMLGVAVDVTQEMLEKKKIEYERDYDLLTNLLNRRAFHARIAKCFENPKTLRTAAFVMFDLDNLKYINDTYGHDFGDEYIRCAASIFKEFIAYNGVVARMSGDEFYVFLSGYEDKKQIRRVIGDVRENLRKATLTLPDSRTIKIRASAGVSWYPGDSASYEELIKYADFAMYKVKNTIKGELYEFDRESYNRDSFLLRSREDLNKLIDEELVEYAFQPIVDAQSGRVFAYEALMRPQMGTLNSPVDVLRLARSQSKLYQIEHLTWFKALKAFDRNQEALAGCKVFINSIPNQLLTESDIYDIEKLYRPLLERVVIELTENDEIDEQATSRKQRLVQYWDCCLALDDFGSGYNGDAVLLSITPDFVKIDMSIVRGIDEDQNRQVLFENLIAYSKERHIKVIAEGVETRSEMETLIALGADYMQGYYLGKPSYHPQGIEESTVQEIRAAAKRRKE